MNRFTLLAILIVVSFSMKLSHKQVPGGWTTGTADPAIDAYIRQQFPALTGAQIQQAKSQVVSGFNYEYTYVLNNVSYVVSVYDQSWTNTRFVTNVSKKQQSTDSSGNVVNKTYTTALNNDDFTTIARTYFRNWYMYACIIGIGLIQQIQYY